MRARHDTLGRVGASDVTESPVLGDESENCCANCFVSAVNWNFKAQQAVQRDSQAHVANDCPQNFNSIAPSGFGFQGSKGASHDQVVATQNVHSHGNLGLCWVQTTLLRPLFFSAVLALGAVEATLATIRLTRLWGGTFGVIRAKHVQMHAHS